VLQEDLRYWTKHLTYCTLRSFFTHQCVLLPVDRSFRIHSSKQHVERKSTLATFRELVMLEPRSELWRSMLLVKFQGIMGTKELMHTNLHHAVTILNAPKRAFAPRRR